MAFATARLPRRQARKRGRHDGGRPKPGTLSSSCRFRNLENIDSRSLRRAVPAQRPSSRWHGAYATGYERSCSSNAVRVCRRKHVFDDSSASAGAAAASARAEARSTLVTIFMIFRPFVQARWISCMQHNWRSAASRSIHDLVTAVALQLTKKRGNNHNNGSLPFRPCLLRRAQDVSRARLSRIRYLLLSFPIGNRMGIAQALHRTGSNSS